MFVLFRQFKKGDIFFNYGCFPQTWEDPTFVHPDAEGCRGDNDPVDVCEIGARIVGPGVSSYYSAVVMKGRFLLRILFAHYTLLSLSTENPPREGSRSSDDD
jgi:hypothetical protein